MKSLLSTLVILTLCLSANAQEEVHFEEEENILTGIAATEPEAISENNIINSSDQNRTLRWTMEIVALTEGWTVALCDKEICSEETTSTISSGFVAFPDEVCRMDVHAYPNGVEGHAIVKVIVTEVNNPDLYLSQYYYFNALPSSTQAVGDVNITLYPNPFTNTFRVTGKGAFDQIDIYSVDGKLLTSFDWEEGKDYDISTLNSGMYIAQMKNNKGQNNSILIRKE